MERLKTGHELYNNLSEAKTDKILQWDNYDDEIAKEETIKSLRDLIALGEKEGVSFENHNILEYAIKVSQELEYKDEKNQDVMNESEEQKEERVKNLATLNKDYKVLIQFQEYLLNENVNLELITNLLFKEKKSTL